MNPIRISSVTPLQIIKSVFLIAFLGLALWYGQYQARFLLAGPQLVLMSPEEQVHEERIVLLEGKAENSTEIRLNGRAINTTEDGYFSEKLVLENGYTIMTLHAKDRYGRATTLTRHFVYKPAS